MADDVVWLPVLPSMKDFGAELAKSAGGAGKKVGQQVGKDIGDGIASAQVVAEKAAQNVAKASDTVVKARAREADQAGKVRVAEAQLQALRDKGVTDTGRLAAAEEKLEKAKRDLGLAAGNTEKATRDLSKAEEDAAKAAEDAAKASDEAAKSVDKLGQSSIFTKENLVKMGAAIGAAAAGAGAALFAIGSDFTNMANTIRVGTGAAGEDLDELVGVAKNLGSQVPASFEDIGGTVADVNTRLGLTGAPLEKLSRQFLELGNMGIDADINDVSAAFTAFGVTGADTTDALDELFQVSQATGLSVGELSTSAVKAGPALRQFGFGLGESAALVGTLDKAGLNADKTLASMNRALMDFAKDGKDPQKALYGTVVEIENLIDAGKEAAALDLAGGMFGTRGASQFVDAVKMGTLSVDDFVSATGATEDTIIGVADETRTFSEQWEMFKNDVLVQLEPIATQVFGIITDAMGWIKDNGVPAAKDFAHWVGENEGKLKLLGGVITAALIPPLTAMTTAWVTAKVEAAISAASQVAASYKAIGGWVAMAVSASVNAVAVGAAWVAAQIQAAAGWVAAQVRAVASFVAMAASATAQAAVTAAAWVGAQARVVAGWIASGASAVASFVAMAASATAQAAVTAAAWVASSARTVGALALQGAAFVAQRAVMIAGAAATAAVTAAQWALNMALNANPIGLVVIAIAALVAGFVVAYQKSETFRNIVQAAWEGIKTAASFVWENVLKPIFAGFKQAIEDVGNAATWLYDNAIKPAWDGIGSAISWVYDNVIKKVTDGIGKAFDTVGGIAEGVASAIKNAFSGVVDILKAPLRLIGQLLSKLPDKIGPFEIPFVGSLKSWGDTLQNLAVGGQVAGRRASGLLFGPGTGTSDSILGVNRLGVPTALVSRGEWVTPEHAVTPRTTPLLEAMRRGWEPSADFVAALVGGVPAFAGGGLVSADQLADFARGIEGQPYVFGGWGNGWATDCSGAMSALANYAVQGITPAGAGSRFATSNQQESLSSLGALPGIGPAGSLSFGWYNGGPWGGHTAATLPDGTNVEMGGARGDGQYGGPAAGAADPMFTDHAHFPPEFFLGGDPELHGDIFGKGGNAGVSTLDVSTSAPGVSSGGGTSVGSSSGGASQVTLRDQIAQTAADAATETVGDTLDFFGLGGLMDLPLMPQSQTADVTPGEVADSADAPTETRQGDAPLISIQQLIVDNAEEAASALGREARRLIRSDALVGGWG